MKKVNRLIMCSIFSFILIILFFGEGNIVLAESAGGQVSKTSGITFSQGEEEPKKEEPKKEEAKKVSSLPKTGELTNQYTILGLGCTGVALIYFIQRRKKYEK